MCANFKSVKLTLVCVICFQLILLGESSNKPNILVIIADDLGIGDIGCYGNYSINTPHIDRLAEDGIKLTHHLAVEAFCSPSRAAFLVSRYPTRFGFFGRGNASAVLSHVATLGHLPHSEVTFAEVLTAANYTTGLVGKWHLGGECQLFGLRCPGPLNHGFSFNYGIIYTAFISMAGEGPFFTMKSSGLNIGYYQGILATTMIAIIISVIFLFKRKSYCSALILLILAIITAFVFWFTCTHIQLHTTYWQYAASSWFYQNMNEILIRNGIPINQTLNFDNDLSHVFINESVHFIASQANKSVPFFLVHSFLHVHTPMFVKKENVGRSCCGRYGDNVEEMDDGVGSLIQALNDYNVQEETIIYFFSDNGGHLEVIDLSDGQRIGGHNKRFKGGKGQGGQEGGIRIPGIISWPKSLPKNITIDIPTSTMDIMPTLLELAGLPTIHELVPNENEIDGRSFAELLKEDFTIPTEDRVLLHHCGEHIDAARLITGSKVYKMELARPKWSENSTQCGWGINAYCNCRDSEDLSSNPLLFELNSDTYEDYPISTTSTEYKNVTQYLKNYVEEWERNGTLGESIFSTWQEMLWLPWYQPFCFWNW